MKKILFIFLCFIEIANASNLKLIVPPLNDTTVKSWEGVKTPLEKQGNYSLPTGFTFDAILETAIFSYNVATPVISYADNDIVYLGQVVIPKETKFIGNVQVLHSLNRVNVDFNTLVFPNGEEIKINFLALSMDGSAGVIGKVEKHKDKVAAKVAMKSILLGAQVGAAAASPSIENAMAVGVSQEAMSSIDVADPKTIESISVEEHTPIKLFIRERTEF